MQARSIRILIVAFAIGAIGALAWQARANSDLVTFPENYAAGVHYTTVNRGNIREEIFADREAIEAIKKGEPLPSGTVITLVDYRSGDLFRYVVMEKRTGWGANYAPALRNGAWEYQSFNPDKSVKADGQPDRCMSCHKSQEHQDFVWTVDQLKSAK
jgi:hypothetical protein